MSETRRGGPPCGCARPWHAASARSSTTIERTWRAYHVSRRCYVPGVSEGLVGAVLDGRYKVIEPIAEGAMGCVYRAERLKLGRAVAIKLMHEELPDQLSSRERFEREAKLMALL